MIPTLQHVRDPDWPPHARFHLIRAICLLTGADLIAIAVALGPLRRRERWAFWIELTYARYPLNVVLEMRSIRNRRVLLSPAFERDDEHHCYFELIS